MWAGSNALTGERHDRSVELAEGNTVIVEKSPDSLSGGCVDTYA
ncbi:hypothetical protein SK355_11235 [Candidatus Fukatsuia symbiotica]|nr:hypothetical protein [Candidatus Fukatsuia symbiotica]MEA9445755.1 hypothetical protein [Candidatus Fukatsuia symbiotica]